MGYQPAIGRPDRLSSKSMNTLGSSRCFGKTMPLETEEYAERLYIAEGKSPTPIIFLQYCDRNNFDLQCARYFSTVAYSYIVTHRLSLIYSDLLSFNLASIYMLYSTDARIIFQRLSLVSFTRFVLSSFLIFSFFFTYFLSFSLKHKISPDKRMKPYRKWGSRFHSENPQIKYD